MQELSIEEAADRLGMTREGVRKRLIKGQLDGRRGNDGRWTVLLSEEVEERLPPIAKRWQQEAERLGQQLATVATERDELKLAVTKLSTLQAALEQRVADKEEIVCDLRSERDRILGIIESQSEQIRLLIKQGEQKAAHSPTLFRWFRRRS